MSDGKKDNQNDELKIEYLPDDGGVKVNGIWYSSLQSYFEKREEELKKKSQ